MTGTVRTCILVLWIAVSVTALMGAGLVVVPRETFAVLALFGMAGRAPLDGYTDFMHGVLGGTMLGWMAMFAGLLKGPIRAGEPWAIRLGIVSTLVWFLPDTLRSASLGQLENVWLNVFSVGFFLVPLVVLARVGGRRGQ